MLIEIKIDNGCEQTSVNSDYIVSLYLQKREVHYQVVARMIDGSLLAVSKLLNQDAAEQEYKRITKEVNKDRIVLDKKVVQEVIAKS